MVLELSNFVALGVDQGMSSTSNPYSNGTQCYRGGTQRLCGARVIIRGGTGRGGP